MKQCKSVRGLEDRSMGCLRDQGTIWGVLLHCASHSALSLGQRHRVYSATKQRDRLKMERDVRITFLDKKDKPTGKNRIYEIQGSSRSARLRKRKYLKLSYIVVKNPGRDQREKKFIFSSFFSALYTCSWLQVRDWRRDLFPAFSSEEF